MWVLRADWGRGMICSFWGRGETINLGQEAAGLKKERNGPGKGEGHRLSREKSRNTLQRS